MRVRGAELMGRAVRTAEGNRDVKLPTRHREHVRRVVYDLIEGHQREAEGHELDYRPQTNHGRADPEAGETIFTDRRIDDAGWTETIKQALAHFISAVVLRDLLAHEEDVLVALQLFRERLVQRLAIGDLSHAPASAFVSPFA